MASGDLTSRGWIIAKGLMFLVIIVLSAAGNLIEERWWMRAGLLAVCVWSACRFYYFIFYVLEHYVGLPGRYAGILDLLKRLWEVRYRRP